MKFDCPINKGLNQGCEKQNVSPEYENVTLKDIGAVFKKHGINNWRIKTDSADDLKKVTLAQLDSILLIRASFKSKSLKTYKSNILKSVFDDPYDPVWYVTNAVWVFPDEMFNAKVNLTPYIGDNWNDPIFKVKSIETWFTGIWPCQVVEPYYEVYLDVLGEYIKIHYHFRRTFGINVEGFPIVAVENSNCLMTVSFTNYNLHLDWYGTSPIDNN